MDNSLHIQGQHMGRYLDPKADIVFKRVFHDHPHLLKSFLNALLPLPDDGQIVELTCVSPEQVPKIPTMKSTIADVFCKDAKGRSFIVEMQINWVDYFKQRLLFEAGTAYVQQLEKGEDYDMLQPVYGLALINTAFDPSPDHWYHHYQLVNVKKPTLETIKDLELVFIELPKFPINSKDEKLLRILWLRFMREINDKTKTISPELLAVPEIEQAVELLEEATYNEGELLWYNKYWDTISVEKTIRSGAFKEGEVKGREEGKAEIIRQMLRSKLPIEQIISITGMSEAEILDLKK